jgi:hypothetical protein
MSAHIRALHAAGEPVVTRPFKIKFGMLAVLLTFALILAGCSDAPRSPVAGPDPADPGARAPRVDYRSTIGSYKSQRPASPGPWREQNEQATPAPKASQ